VNGNSVEESVREQIVSLVQRVLKDGTFSMRQLAEDAGLKYDVVRAWAIGRRAPTPDNLSRIAAGFEHRAEQLQRMARELREAAGESAEQQR
jgi:transcriptional regulator with XRE-family HTH domain